MADARAATPGMGEYRAYQQLVAPPLRSFTLARGNDAVPQRARLGAFAAQEPVTETLSSPVDQANRGLDAASSRCRNDDQPLHGG